MTLLQNANNYNYNFFYQFEKHDWLEKHFRLPYKSDFMTPNTAAETVRHKTKLPQQVQDEANKTWQIPIRDYKFSPCRDDDVNNNNDDNK